MTKAAQHLLVVIALLAYFTACSAKHTTREDTNRNQTTAAPTSSPATRRTSSVGFASREKLLEHYRKHGREFGNISVEEYLEIAQTLRDQPAGGGIVEAVRADGVVTRFDRNTGVFIAFNRDDGTIRTCFKPNDGEAYFRRQLKRS
jgi:pyocin large subunit-like protein